MRSVFPNAINYFIFKQFLRRLYFSWKNIWEWKILELLLLNCCNLNFSNSQGFNNMQFKSSAGKNIWRLAVSKFNSTNVLLNFSSRFSLQDNIKPCNFQFCRNLKLLIRYFLFRNLPCSNTNLLTVKADRISAALDISGVSRIIGLDNLNIFWQDRA